MTLIFEYLNYSFVRYALIVGVLISFCSSLLGNILVSKKMSFIGDSLSKLAFLITSVATILKLSSNFFITLIGTTIFTIFLLNKKNSLIKRDDSILAMISVVSLALGYICINLFSNSSNVTADVCTTLFGSTSILTLRPYMVVACILLSIFILVMFVLFYNKIYLVTFDEDFALSNGVNVERINFLISIMTSFTIVLSMYLVGSLLITALIIFPTLCARFLVKSFKKTIVASSILSITCALIGMIISILMGTPVGSTIVVINFIAYIICLIANKFFIRR